MVMTAHSRLLPSVVLPVSFGRVKSDFRAADDERVDMRLTRRVVHKLAWVLGGIGVFGSLLGVIIGFATADHAVPIPCGPGQGQLDACYSHPQLGVGSAIGFISL